MARDIPSRRVLRTFRDIVSARVVVNGAYLAVSNAVQYALAFFTGVLIARWLGADALGVYGLASAVGQIASRIADAGMGTIITRMISRSDPLASRGLRAALGFRLWSGLFSIAAVEAVGLAAGYELDVQVALVLYAVGQTIGALRELASSAYYGRQRLARPAIASALFRIVSFAFTLAFLLTKMSVIWSIVALLIGQLFASGYLASGPEPDARQFPVRVDLEGTKAILRQSYPLAVSGIFTMVNMRADAMVLSLHVDKAQLGLYNGAYAVLIGLSLFPSSLLPALYPELAERFHRDRRAAARLFVRSQALSGVLGILLALAFTFAAPVVMHTLYGARFDGAGPVLAVLCWAAPCTYLSYANSMFFNASDRQRLNLWTAVVAGGVNVVANVVLDPIYGIMGAAWATIISEASFLAVTTVLVVIVVREDRRS